MSKRTLTCSPMRKRSSVRASYDYNISNDSKRRDLILDQIINEHLSTREAISLLSHIISGSISGADACDDIIQFAAGYLPSDDLFDAWQDMREDMGMRTYRSWDEYVDEVLDN